MSKMVTVTKEVTFDCAHILTGHDGLCKNLHGHTYRLQVSVTGPLIEAGPKEGMVIDFKDLKTLINEFIMDKYDHAFIAKGDEDTLRFAMASGLKYHTIGVRTTVENMVPVMHNELQTGLRKKYPLYNCYISEIKLWETPKSFATYTYKPE